MSGIDRTSTKRLKSSTTLIITRKANPECGHHIARIFR